MPVIAVTILKLKIVDCADNDEDMNLHLKVYIKRAGHEQRIYSQSYADVYVEEEGKIGNDSKCTFFSGVTIEPIEADECWIDVDLATLDKDGMAWGGHHLHLKNAHSLNIGENTFREGREHSSNPGTQGVYELHFTIDRK